MFEFSAFELRVLRWFSHHHVKSSEEIPAIVPRRYLKTTLFLLSENALLETTPFITLSQLAKDALSQSRELFWVNLFHNFWVGFVTGFIAGIAATLFCTVLT